MEPDTFGRSILHDHHDPIPEQTGFPLFHTSLFNLVEVSFLTDFKRLILALRFGRVLRCGLCGCGWVAYEKDRLFPCCCWLILLQCPRQALQAEVPCLCAVAVCSEVFVLSFRFCSFWFAFRYIMGTRYSAEKVIFISRTFCFTVLQLFFTKIFHRVPKLRNPSTLTKNHSEGRVFLHTKNAQVWNLLSQLPVVRFRYFFTTSYF